MPILKFLLKTCKNIGLGWDFSITPEQQQQSQWQSSPHKSADSHIGEDSSC